MRQHCLHCGKELEDGRVMVMGPADFEQFTDGIHRVYLVDVSDMWCMECEDMENGDDELSN